MREPHHHQKSEYIYNCIYIKLLEFIDIKKHNIVFGSDFVKIIGNKNYKNMYKRRCDNKYDSDLLLKCINIKKSMLREQLKSLEKIEEKSRKNKL